MQLLDVIWGVAQFDAETDPEEKKLPLHKTRWFWLRLIPGLLTAALLVVGIVMVITVPNVSVYFEVRHAEQSAHAAHSDFCRQHKNDLNA